jgi:hypothetical protein
MRPTDFWYNELGCMLMTRRLLELALENFDHYGNIASAIFNTVERANPPGGYCKMPPVIFDVEHLDGYEMSFQNLGPSKDYRLICPAPALPDDAFSVLPPCLVEVGP